MKIIIPQEILPPPFGDQLQYCNIPEDGAIDPEQEYNSGLTYTVGQRVLVTANHTVYEAIQSVPISTPPPTPPETSNDYWIKARVSDTWAVFDAVINPNRITTNTHYLRYIVRPGQINAVAVFNIIGKRVEIKVTDTTNPSAEPFEDVGYTSSITGADPSLGLIVHDWWEYFYGETEIITDFAWLSVPTYSSPEVTITVWAAEPEDTLTDLKASLGEIVMGNIQTLGITQSQPEFSIIDYSKKEVDVYGNWNIIPRSFSKRIDIKLVVMTSAINKTATILTGLRTTPVVWVPTELYEYKATLLVYGYYRDFRMVIPHHLWSEMNLQIEGLT